MAWSKNLDWSVFYQIPDGYMDLTGNKFVIKQGSHHVERIVCEEELVNILHDYFKIDRSLSRNYFQIMKISILSSLRNKRGTNGLK